MDFYCGQFLITIWLNNLSSNNNPRNIITAQKSNECLVISARSFPLPEGQVSLSESDVDRTCPMKNLEVTKALFQVARGSWFASISLMLKLEMLYICLPCF